MSGSGLPTIKEKAESGHLVHPMHNGKRLYLNIESPAGNQEALPFKINEREVFMVDLDLKVVSGVRPDPHMPCEVAVTFEDRRSESARRAAHKSPHLDGLFTPIGTPSVHRLHLDEVNRQIDLMHEACEVSISLDTEEEEHPKRKVTYAKETQSIALRKQMKTTQQSMPLKPNKYERHQSSFFKIKDNRTSVESLPSTNSDRIVMMEMLKKVENEGDLPRFSSHASFMASQWNQK
uniref:Uncharacterized protein n=1 Tax=Polyblepharides amylifera TaxID=1486889 RepID=A0A7R9SVV7_9CHLO